eukprot:UN31059
MDPNLSKAQKLFNKGIEFIHDGKHKKGQIAFEEAVILDKTFTAAIYQLAIIKQRCQTLAQLNQVCKLYRQVIAIDRTFVRAYWGLADILNRLQNFEEAKWYYQKTLELEAHPTVHYSLATCYVNLQRYDEAEAEYNKVVRWKEVGHNFVYFGLALLFQNCKKEYENAYEAYEQYFLNESDHETTENLEYRFHHYTKLLTEQLKDEYLINAASLLRNIVEKKVLFSSADDVCNK